MTALMMILKLSPEEKKNGMNFLLKLENNLNGTLLKQWRILWRNEKQIKRIKAFCNQLQSAFIILEKAYN